MPQENPAPAPSANIEQPAVGSAQTSQPEVEIQNVLTPEAVKAMIEESNRPLHAEIRRLREGASPKQAKQSETERTLTARVADIEAREARLAENRKIDALRLEASKAGVTPERLDLFTDHVLARKGSQIVSTETGAAWVDIDPDNPRPLADLVREIMKSQSDVFKPSAPLPQARGLRANARVAAPTRFEDVPMEEKLKMSNAALRKLAQDSISSQG